MASVIAEGKEKHEAESECLTVCAFRRHSGAHLTRSEKSRELAEYLIKKFVCSECLNERRSSSNLKNSCDNSSSLRLQQVPTN